MVPTESRNRVQDTTKSPHPQWPSSFDQSPCSHSGRPLLGEVHHFPPIPNPSQDGLTSSWHWACTQVALSLAVPLLSLPCEAHSKCLLL